MRLQRITFVRFGDVEGRRLLEKYLFSGMYGGPRVPRGIEPKVVASVINDQLKPDSTPNAYSRALEAARFYELTEVVPKTRTLLVGPARDADDLRRKLHAVQIVAELGTVEDVASVASYFDNTLVPHSLLPRDFRLPLLALESLAPAGSGEKVLARIKAEVAALEKKQKVSEADMTEYDKIAAVLRNDWPRTKLAVAAKTRLAAQPPDQGRVGLVQMYLGRLPGSDDLTEVWAARMLRLEAINVDLDPVCAEFGKVVDAADPARINTEPLGGTVVRAAQAIVYLQGTLTTAQREKYAKAKGAANFLWDDPG